MIRPFPVPTIAVFVHGAGAGGWEWNIWARVFVADSFEVLTRDLAPDAQGLAATRFSDYRDQVVQWCTDAAARRDPVRIVLVGASLGGLLCLSVASQCAVSALVLVNPMPPAGVLACPLGDPQAGIVPWGSRRSISSTRRAMPDADAAARQYAYERWRDESGDVLEQARVGVTVDLPRCPTLILASERDDDVPAMASRALALRCRADFELLAGASHVGPLLGTSAAATAHQATRWLQRRLPCPTSESLTTV